MGVGGPLVMSAHSWTKRWRCHIPPDLVVDQQASDGESSSNHVFLFLHDVWAMFCRYIGEKIASTISMAWHFTTKSGGICESSDMDGGDDSTGKRSRCPGPCGKDVICGIPKRASL